MLPGAFMSSVTNHPLFNEAYNRYQQAAQQMQLGIIMLGPNATSVGYAKRKQLKEHLINISSGRYDVDFIEDLQTVDTGRPTSDPWEKIAFYVASADIIFALTVDDKSVTGVLAEITRFMSDKAFLEKTFVIVPVRSGPRKKSKRVPLIWQSVNGFPDEQKFQYTPQQLEDCRVIRDWIADKARRPGLKAKYNEFLAQRGISPPYPY